MSARFSEGDRVQFTAPDKTLKIANRELGTIESIDERGNVEIKLDSGREVRFNLEENRHLDYGYAVTSHSSQGATADRVLVQRRYRAGAREAHQQPPGVCRRFPRPLRCADLHQRRRQSRRSLSREVSHAAAVEDWKHDAGKSDGPDQETTAERRREHGDDHAESHGHAMAMEH